MAGDGRVISVAPERLAGWLRRFDEAHGATADCLVGNLLVVAGADGARAEIRLGWEPLIPPPGGAVREAALEYLLAARRIGAVLVRKGGFAVGRFVGSELAVAKVGARHVQGRTKAGGWSQQRYARRREHQAHRAYSAAADTVAAILADDPGDFVVAGGDRGAVTAVLADPRLSRVQRAWALTGRQLVAVGDPTRAVLVAFGDQIRAVQISLNAAAQQLDQGASRPIDQAPSASE